MGVPCDVANANPYVIQMISAEWTGRYGILGVPVKIGVLGAIPWQYEIQVEWYVSPACPPRIS